MSFTPAEVVGVRHNSTGVVFTPEKVGSAIVALNVETMQLFKDVLTPVLVEHFKKAEGEQLRESSSVPAARHLPRTNLQPDELMAKDCQDGLTATSKRQRDNASVSTGYSPQKKKQDFGPFDSSAHAPLALAFDEGSAPLPLHSACALPVPTPSSPQAKADELLSKILDAGLHSKHVRMDARAEQIVCDTLDVVLRPLKYKPSKKVQDKNGNIMARILALLFLGSGNPNRTEDFYSLDMSVSALCQCLCTFVRAGRV